MEPHMTIEQLADAPAPDTDVAPGKDAPAAAPPPTDKAEGAGNEPKSSLEALTQRLEAMKVAKDAPAEAKPEVKPEAKPDEDDTPGDTPEEKQAFKGKPAGDQIKDLRGRLRAASRELNEFKAKAGDFETIKTRASQFEEFSGWVKSTGLTQEEVQEGLAISALMKSDPFKALEAVTPIYRELQKRAGAVLPEDIASAVESGEMTESHAQELARLRREREHFAGRSEASSRALQEQEQAAVVQRTQLAVRDAINRAETDVKTNDPDYKRKEPWIRDQIKAMWMDEGVPDTAERAVDQYKRAVKAVNDRVALMSPRRQSSAPLDGGAPPTTAVPKTSMEAMRMAAQAKGIRIAG